MKAINYIRPYLSRRIIRERSFLINRDEETNELSKEILIILNRINIIKEVYNIKKSKK